MTVMKFGAGKVLREYFEPL